jgi:aminoglycoside 6-adenylyltransferase
LNETAWFERLGDALLTFIERTAVGEQFERRVLYRGGLDVDFNIFPDSVFRSMIEGGLPTEVQGIFRRGVRVLIDKDEVMKKLTVAPENVPSPPTVQEFIQHVNDFLYHAVWTAKKMRRGELWVAKFCCDGYMKRLLLRMIEWHACTVHGWGFDTWFEGRFLERWTDPEILVELRKTFAHYDASDIKNALLQTIEMHRRLSIETSTKLGYHIPDEKYSEIFGLVRSYLDT